MPHKSREAGRKACKAHYDANKDYYYQRNLARRVALRQWIDSLKTGPCSVCGQSYPAKAMDWHHRDPTTKEFDIGGAVQRGLGRERVAAEIAKCVLMCAVCHRLAD